MEITCMRCEVLTLAGMKLWSWMWSSVFCKWVPIFETNNSTFIFWVKEGVYFSCPEVQVVPSKDSYLSAKLQVGQEYMVVFWSEENKKKTQFITRQTDGELTVSISNWRWNFTFDRHHNLCLFTMCLMCEVITCWRRLSGMASLHCSMHCSKPGLLVGHMLCTLVCR